MYIVSNFRRKRLKIEQLNRAFLLRPVDLLLEHDKISRNLDALYNTNFLHPLLTGSNTTTRSVGALVASSVCHLRHCAPTVRRALLYNKKTRVVPPSSRPRHNRLYAKTRFQLFFPPNSAAHVTLNSIHFAADDSWVFIW